MTEQYFNNPLHGLKLESLVTELVEFYGWEILAAALNFNCFKTNPSIKGSVKFLRKTEWARHKIEAFYLYKFKHLPRPDDKQFALPPRDRIIPEDQKPREPITYTLEQLAEINERKAKETANRGPKRGGKPAWKQADSRDDRPRTDRPRNDRPREERRPAKPAYSESTGATTDPWAQARKNLAKKQNQD